MGAIHAYILTVSQPSSQIFVYCICVSAERPWEVKSLHSDALMLVT